METEVKITPQQLLATLQLLEDSILQLLETKKIQSAAAVDRQKSPIRHMILYWDMESLVKSKISFQVRS